MLHCWLCRQRKRVWAKGCRRPLKARKRQASGFFPRTSRRNTDLQIHFRLLASRTVKLWIWLFSATKFVVTCYISRRKVIHKAYVYLIHREYLVNKSRCWGEWKHWKGLWWDMLGWIHWQQFLWVLYPVLPWGCLLTHPPQALSLLCAQVSIGIAFTWADIAIASSWCLSARSKIGREMRE